MWPVPIMWDYHRPHTHCEVSTKSLQVVLEIPTCKQKLNQSVTGVHIIALPILQIVKLTKVQHGHEIR
jgi:hypothetical protein